MQPPHPQIVLVLPLFTTPLPLLVIALLCVSTPFTRQRRRHLSHSAHRRAAGKTLGGGRAVESPPATPLRHQDGRLSARSVTSRKTWALAFEVLLIVRGILVSTLLLTGSLLQGKYGGLA